MALHTAIKLISGIVVNKVVAVYLGPSGFSLISQFQNFSGIISGLSNASIQTGVVKQTASSKSEIERKAVWSNALAISIFISILISILLYFSAENWVKYSVIDEGYTYIIELLAFSVVFYALNIFIISVLNGLSEIKKFTVVNVGMSLITLLVVPVLTYTNGIQGSMLGFICSQLLVFFLTMIVYRETVLKFFHVSVGFFSKSEISVLLQYGLTTFASGFILSISSIAIRTIIIEERGLVDAGLWDALYKLPVYFSLIFSMPISIYYLPKFSSCSERSELVGYVRNIFLRVTPVVFFVAICVIILSDWLVNILFSHEFLPITQFFFLILSAQVIKIWADVFSLVFFAKQKLILFLISELLFWSVVVFGVYFYYSDFGLGSVVLFYLFGALAILFVNIVFFRRCLKYVY